jgi:hypothetical protein
MNKKKKKSVRLSVIARKQKSIPHPKIKKKVAKKGIQGAE